MALKAGMVILAVLYCSSSVHSEDPIITTKKYEFNTKHLLIGTNNIDKRSLIYALCDVADDKQSAKCTINYENDVFDDSQARYSCPFDLVVAREDGQLQIVEINLWNSNQAIFIWQETNQRNIRDAEITINTVYLDICIVSTRKLKIANRKDDIPQVFIVPYENHYEVTFMAKEHRGTEFSKIFIDSNDESSDILVSFEYPGLVQALVPIEKQANKLLITVGESVLNNGIVRFYLMYDKEHKKLEKFDYVDDIGWSTSNGIISMCNFFECIQYDTEGNSKTVKRLGLPSSPIKYAALYNLPNRDLLAAICDSGSSDLYRIVKIGARGAQEYFFELTDLKCSTTVFLTGKFFEQAEDQYCLSVFYSPDDSGKNVKFSTYCFSP